MLDVKSMNMSELIAQHNVFAAQLGVAEEQSFKSLNAARTAVLNLEKKVNDATNTPTETEAPFEGGTVVTENTTAPTPADREKYNSSGKRGPNQGVGAYAKEQIAAGKSNAEALAAVLAKFPEAKTTTSCIAYYRTAMKKGPAKPDAAALRVKAQELLAAAEAAEKAAAEEAAKAPVEPEPATV
jgi:hypothetical protein